MLPFVAVIAGLAIFLAVGSLIREDRRRHPPLKK